MPDLPELIVHIGAGKTGSTAIQFSLREAATGPALARQGAGYVGLMLERVPGARRHDWCAEGAPQKFFQARDRAQTDAEVYQVIRGELERLAARGINRVIWSNEAFLVQNQRIIPILQRLAADGVPIRVVAYVRRHDARARSAYVEFGLKSKRNEGGLRPFADWARDHAIRYADNLALWQAAFPGALRLYNFDAVGDVGAHFCAAVGLEGIVSVRANESPSDPLLAAWAVYNGSRPEPTWANDFRRVAQPLKIQNPATPPVPPLEALMPGDADLAALRDSCRGDLEAVNAILSAQGQPVLEFTDRGAGRPVQVSSWDMDQMMLRMIYALQGQVLRLQRQVDELTGKDAE